MRSLDVEKFKSLLKTSAMDARGVQINLVVASKKLLEFCNYSPQIRFPDENRDSAIRYTFRGRRVAFITWDASAIFIIQCLLSIRIRLAVD
jgi:hypothetical protein